jgi:hypothetical protein
MPVESGDLVIKGVTLAGQPFRPSDWAERLCAVMSGFGSDGRTRYSPYVFPISSGGVSCVVVHKALQAIAPMAYNFLLNFARDNELQTPGAMPQGADGEEIAG